MIEVIINNLKLLKSNLIQLPYERFYDIWQYLNIILYIDIIRIKKEIPELIYFINSAVTIINFQKEHYDTILNSITKEDTTVTNLYQIYPHIKYVDELILSINDRNIDQIRNQKYLRNIIIYAKIKDNIDQYYDLIYNIIARNKGVCMISLTISGDTNTYYNNCHSVSYNRGEVEVNGKYLINKVISMKPEKVILRLPETNIVDILRLSSIPTVHSLHFSFLIDGDDVCIYIYRILTALLYINTNMNDEEIKRIYDSSPTLILDDSDIAFSELKPRHVKSITYSYVSNKCSTDSDYYDYLLSSTITDEYIHGTSHTFPEVKVMSLPISVDDYHNWCRILPNVNNFISDDTFMVEVIEKRNQQLLDSITNNTNILNGIKDNLASVLRSHQENIPLL